MARLPAASVAAVRGRARGGGAEFTLACDIRFASLERAIFAQIGHDFLMGDNAGVRRLLHFLVAFAAGHNTDRSLIIHYCVGRLR
jgi:enoyl-CoA hydratase/carnithine racemase